MPTSGVGEINPLAPVFFLSYTRGETPQLARPHDVDHLVLRLFNDLVDLLNPLIARRAGAEYGFIDRNLRGGHHWEPNLLYALGCSQVFVALTSAPYFASEYCGKEWDGFSRRAIGHLQQGATRFDSAIVPVVWAPNLSGREPGVARGLQRFTPGPGYHEQAYFENGIYGLLVTGREDEYKEVTWRLARHIANTFYSCRVETAELEEKTLRDVFQEVVP